ncbi:hypothetical protein ACHAWX_002376 [Stephanocyclus meneghinianus]
MTDISPAPRPLKRDIEGHLKSDAPSTKPPPPRPSPNSEVKKQHAAISLAHLFTTTQDSLASCESGTEGTLGEAENFLAECFSGDAAEGEDHDHAVPIAAAAGMHEDVFCSPKKKPKVAGPARVSSEGEAEQEQEKHQETPLAMKAGAYRLNKLMEATKFTSPMPEHPTAPPCQRYMQPIHDDEIPPKRIGGNRKEKSLALLCQNFMDLCRDAPPCGPNDETGALVELNELAAHLGVKRRRIYDIINIMESVHIVSRLKKNTYRWHGTEKLPLYFAQLQKEGLREMQQGIRPDEKQIKGMSLTCQKLIQYFLVTGLMEIRLADAAEAVLGPSKDEEKSFKTKIRRMYDIANVLTSLGIIRKENVAGSSTKAQPSFRWVYPISPQEMSQHLPPGEKGVSEEEEEEQLLHGERVDLAQEMEDAKPSGAPVTPEDRIMMV